MQEGEVVRPRKAASYPVDPQALRQALQPLAERQEMLRELEEVEAECERDLETPSCASANGPLLSCSQACSQICSQAEDASSDDASESPSEGGWEEECAAAADKGSELNAGRDGEQETEPARGHGAIDLDYSASWSPAPGGGLTVTHRSCVPALPLALAPPLAPLQAKNEGECPGQAGEGLGQAGKCPGGAAAFWEETSESLKDRPQAVEVQEDGQRASPGSDKCAGGVLRETGKAARPPPFSETACGKALQGEGFGVSADGMALPTEIEGADGCAGTHVTSGEWREGYEEEPGAQGWHLGGTWASRGKEAPQGDYSGCWELFQSWDDLEDLCAAMDSSAAEGQSGGRGGGEDDKSAVGTIVGMDLTSWLQEDHLSLSVRFDLKVAEREDGGGVSPVSQLSSACSLPSRRSRDAIPLSEGAGDRSSRPCK